MQRFMPRILLVLVLLATFMSYRPGLSGPFIFDDGINIVNNTHLKIHDLSPQSLSEAAFSVPSGVFMRPISMLSFALNYYYDAGSSAVFSFKLTNLVIHLFNGVAVFVLVWQLMALYRERRQPGLPSAYPQWLALVVSAAWLLHPLNLTSVLYAVQRMTSLAAFFTLLGLIAYLWGRARLYTGQRGGIPAILAGLLVFTPLAILSKENGALLPFFMLAAELTLFKFETAEPITRRFLMGFFVLCTVLPVLVFIAYLALHPDWLLASYSRRDFTLSERLMTEARVVWFYLRLIVLPSTSLMGLYHDDIVISRQLLEPFTTLPAILGILALLGGVWLLRRRMPLAAFGMLFFIVGHGMESTFLPLELVHEHRNYLPMLGILLVFFHGLIEPIHAAKARLPRRVVAAFLIALFAAGTFFRASSWGNSLDLWSAEVEHHPASARANTEIGDFIEYLSQNDPRAMEINYPLARRYFERATALQKNNVNGLFGLIRLSVSHGKPVEHGWLDELAYRLEHEAIPANVNDQLGTMAQCLFQYACPLSASQFETLLNASLRNQKISLRDKVVINSITIYYLFNIVRDFPAAAEAARRSIEWDPQELESRLSLVTILVAMQRHDEAREQISLFKSLDKKGARTRDIDLLEKQLGQGG